MKNKSKPLLFFGNERLLSGVDFEESPILKMLLAEGFDVVGVVLNKHETKSRVIKTDATADLAKQHGLTVYYPESSAEIEKIIKETKAYAAILVAFGLIIPESSLDKLPGGVINVHPSLLPKYRGPSPIETALLNGDKKIGVSIMKLVKKMDSGPIYLQQSINLSEDEDKVVIARKLLKKASLLLRTKLDLILDGSLRPTNQDENQASYTNKLDKSSSFIDPSTMTAEYAVRLVRAYKYYPKARLKYKNHQLIVTEAHISEILKGLAIQCTDNNYLIIDKLITPSGKLSSGEDYLRGYTRHLK